MTLARLRRGLARLFVVTRLRAARHATNPHVVVTLVSTDPTATVSWSSSRYSRRDRGTQAESRACAAAARATRGRGRDTAAPASRTARSTVGRARREGTTYLIADRLRAAPHVCPACIACLSFSSMRVTPRLYGERYLPEVSSRFDERDAAPFCRALLRAR